MIWSKENIYILSLFSALVVCIGAAIYFNRESSTNNIEKYKRKILILHISNNPNNLSQLLHEIDTDSSPYDLLKISRSNYEVNNWLNISQHILQHYNSYDGFIITQSDNSIPYLATALSFIVENNKKPIIISNQEKNNLLNSLTLASNTTMPETVICTEGRVLKGCRSTYIPSNGVLKIISPNFPKLGSIEGKKIKLNDKLINSINNEKINLLSINPKNRVVIVKVFPDLHPQYLKSLGSIKGLILDISSEVLREDIVEQLQRMIDNGVIVVAITNNMTEYLEKMGVIDAKDMTTEAVYVKLLVLLSNIPDSKEKNNMIKKLLQFNMKGEL